MPDSSLSDAIDRLNHAIDRIEAVSQGSGTTQAALEQRHATLRTRVQETIERLDAMLVGAA